jgi:hypothetical protein
MEKRLGPMTFNDVVAKAKSERWSGLLTIESAEVCEHVSFANGEVAGFSSEERRKLIGDILTEAGKIDREQLKVALAQQREAQGAKRLGDILVDMGLIARKALEETIALHQMNVLSECMTEIHGELTFQEGAGLPPR